MDFLDFRRLPSSSGGFSELFLDYLYDYPKVQEYFAGNFRDTASFDSACIRQAAVPRDRQTLASVAGEQQKRFGCGQPSIDNAARLANPETFAVVTGQQVGLYGGPLYTVYKALTAVQLAANLTRQFPQRTFVPVFWLEGEDHDFAEMNHAGLFDPEYKITTVSYLPGGVVPERNLGAVGAIAFDETFAATLEATEAALGKSEFTPAILGMLKEAYQPGATFLSAFAGWMARLFGERGLVIIDPSDPRLKKIVGPVFEKELESYPKSSQLVIAQSAELEERYHAQIKAKSLNLFMFHKGGRYLIEPRETDFSLKGTRAFFSKDDVMKLAKEQPEALSPNVILRPLCQDTLLPTIAYVAGPSEVAYFAQLRPVYEAFGIPLPVIYPRASVSIVQSSAVRTMEKYGLDIEAFYGDISRVSSAVADQISEIKLEPLFEDSLGKIRDSLGEVRFGLNEIDPTLLGPLENTVGKIESLLSVLKEKSLAAQRKRNETAVRQVERAAAVLLPEGSLQERQVNILYYMNKLGPDLVSWIDARIDIGAFSHQFLVP
jgi:bacillithiol synthase